MIGSRRQPGKPRLRLRRDGWFWLSRRHTHIVPEGVCQLGWLGPYGDAKAAYEAATQDGALWRPEELEGLKR